MTVSYDRDYLLTATEATTLLPISVQLVSIWKAQGKLKPVKHRGRSPLYRFGDVMDVEQAAAEAAAAANNHRARRPIAA